MMAVAGRARGRKPADTPNYQRVGYEAVWVAIRELREFTLTDLITHIGKKSCWSVNDNTVSDYVYRLKNGGYLSVSQRTPRSNGICQYTYQLVRDIGIHAPRLRRDGTESTQGLGRTQMWRSMKMLKTFDARDLSITSSNETTAVSEGEAKSYIQHLAHAGYLALVQAANTHGGLARYTLKPSRNSGPRAPQIQRVKRVYDPNWQRVVWDERENDNAN